MLSGFLFPDALPTWALFTEMAMAGLVVILSGSKLTRMADYFADRRNLSSGWVGLLLLASVTSLPELVSGGTATVIGNVDLALGGIFGSCCFNITLIVLLNALLGDGSVLRGVGALHSLTSSLGIVLIAEGLFGIVLLGNSESSGGFLWAYELVWAAMIAITYLGGMHLVYKFEHGQEDQGSAGRDARSMETSFYLGLGLTTLTLVVASWWLARLGDVLSTHEIKMIGRPLGATFVGACFLALATSLPEIATSVAAVRLGNVELALGNIFGSNMFNIFVISILKVVSLCNGDERLLGSVGSNTSGNMIAGLLAILLTAIVLGGLAYQSKRRMLRRFGFDSILIAITYVGGMILLVINGGN